MPVYHSVSRVHLFLTRRTPCWHCENFADLRFQLLTAANVSRRDEPQFSCTDAIYRRTIVAIYPQFWHDLSFRWVNHQINMKVSRSLVSSKLRTQNLPLFFKCVKSARLFDRVCSHPVKLFCGQFRFAWQVQFLVSASGSFQLSTFTSSWHQISMKFPPDISLPARPRCY